MASGNCGYAGYSTAINGQADALYTFQADWLKENIKFDHGSLMGVYKLVNDGQHLENEEDKYQFGETNIVYEKEYNDYDFIAEGDSFQHYRLYSADSVVLKMVPSEAMAEDILITQPAERMRDTRLHYPAV